MVNDQTSADRNGAVTWKSIGRSVQGATHKRSGLPNQDAIAYWPATGHGTHLILAVADGHGGSKYFRSNHGSHLAVTTALKVLQTFARGGKEQAGGSNTSSEYSATHTEQEFDLSNPTVISRMAEDQLPKLLTRQWLEAVEEHIKNHPLEIGELEKLAKSDPQVAAAVKSTGAPTPIAYGTTLLTVVVTDSFILYLQIGDGDILVVTNEEVHRPITGDSRLLANETTSLCTKEAWRDFRVKVQPTIDSTPPELILVSTDGYANSFRDEDSFCKVGPDLLQMVDQYGMDGIQNRLQAWLDEASQKGSGDDVTLGVLKPLRDSDREVMARNVEAVRIIGEDSLKRSDEIQEQVTTINESLLGFTQSSEARLKALEESLESTSKFQHQINALYEREPHYQSLEKHIKSLWRIVIFGLILIVGADVFLHVLFRRPPTQQTTSELPASPSSSQNTSQGTSASSSSSTNSNSNTATEGASNPSPRRKQPQGKKRNPPK